MAKANSIPRPVFTDRYIKALKPKASVYRERDGLPDPNLKGFGIVIAPSGTKSWYVGYTSPETGERTQLTLGIYPALNTAKAREMARDCRQQIREGTDPKLEVERRKQAAIETQAARELAKRRETSLGTVEKLFELYAEDLEMDGKPSADYVRGIYRTDIGPAIGYMKARDVKVDDADDILAAALARGAKVLPNRIRQYGIAAFNFGMRTNRLHRWKGKAPEFDIETNPFAQTEKPLEDEPRGERHLSKNEVRAVWKALETPFEVTGGRGAKRMVSFDLSTQIAIKMQLTTGQRVEEILHASWIEFDLEEKIWTIPAGRRKNYRKNRSKEPHLVFLTDLHVGLLEALRPFSEGSQYLFPDKSGKKPRDHRSLSQAISRLCARTDIEKFSPRDIRRTWKTLAGSIGIDLEIRNRVQGHAFGDVGSKNYDRYSYAREKRAAMDKWTAALQRWITDADNVVPMVREVQA